jgi:TP901 family phage tail tape measure protein
VNAFSIFGRMSLDDSDYQRGLRSAEGETKKAADRMAQDWKKVGEAAQTVGKVLSVALTAPIVAFGALAIRTAGDFEAAMNKVRGITQATGEDFQRLEQLAKDLGASTQFSASQAADAMGFLAMAGFDVDEIMSSLPGVLELAAAGSLDLARAADIASNVLSGFGLEAGEIARVSDVLAKAGDNANTTVEQLGNAFKFVAPVAAALGVSVEESAAAIGIMSDAGIQGEMAGTALRNILAELAKESDTLGVSVFDTRGQMLPLADIIEQIEQRGLNTSEAMSEFGMRAGPALQTLLSSGSAALRELQASLEDSAGYAATRAAINMEGFNGAVKSLSSAVEGLQIAIAQSGLLAFFQGLVERFTSLIRFLTTLNPQLLQLVTIIGAFAAALGPALFIFGRLLLEIPKMTAALAVLRGALASLFVGPQAIIVLAVLAVVALAEAYRRNFGGIQEKTEEVFRALREAFQSFREQFQVVIDALQTAWVRLTNAFGDSWGSMSEQIATIFAAYINNVVGFIVFLLTNLARIIEIGVLIVEEWEMVSEGFRLIMQGISRTVQLVGQVISGSFSLAAAATQAVFNALANSVRKVFIDILNGVINLVNSAIGNMQPFVRRFGIELNGIKALNSTTWEEIRGTMSDEITAARFAVDGALQGIQATYQETVRNVGIILAELRAKLVETGQSTEELDDAIIEVGKATVTTTDAFQSFTGALGTDGASGAANGLTGELNLLSIAGINAAIAAAELGLNLAETDEQRLDFSVNIAELKAMREAMLAAIAPRDITPEIVVTIDDTLQRIAAAHVAYQQSRAQSDREFRRAQEHEAEMQRRAAQDAELTALREQGERLLAAQREYQTSRVQGDREFRRAQEHAEFTALREQGERLVAAQREYQDSRIQGDREFRRAQEHAAEMNRRAELEAEEARRKELEDRERAHVAAMISQSNLLRYARLEASAQARTVAQDDLAFTLSMVERSFGPIQSLDEAWRAFAQYGLTMTADMLVFLQEKFAVVEVSAEDLAQANLELATANLEAVQAAQRLGEATEDDVNAALVRQAQALVALRNQLDPTNARWATATNQLADMYDGLRANETALLDQMSRVHENTAEWTELEEQLERIRGIMALLGLDTGGPGVPKEVDSIIQAGVTALRSYLDAAGGNIATFGNAALDIATKFPLVSSALEGFSIEILETGEIIVNGFSPVKALTAMFMELLNRSESFQKLLGMVNERLAPLAERIIEPLVNVLTILIEALWPLIEVVVNVIELAMQPMVWIWTNVLGPLLTGLANTIRNVWNAFAAVIPGMKRIKDPKKVDKQGPRVLTVTEGGAQYAGLTIRMDTIAGQEQMLQAAREFERTATTQRDRDFIRAEIERRQSAIASMRGAPDPNTIAPPTPPGEKEPPEVVVPPPAGSIEALRAEAAALNAERARTTDPARLAEINNRLFDINLEVRRLEAIGMPRDEVTAPPTPTTPRAPAGSIAALEEERRALQDQLRVASESEIPELNTRIAALNEEINRLQRLGLGGDLAQEIGETIEKAAFGATPQSVQLAVATPLVEASYRMLDAADVMNRVFGSMMPGSESGFGALPPFTSAIERMTPVLERLLEEGVSVMMGQRGDTGPMSSPTAFLRGV